MSLLSNLNFGGKPLSERPSITPLDVHHGDAELPEKKYFQYWPEDIQVSKHINWDVKNIPGLSHPIYQWISGGSREITFTAIFTRDRALTDEEKAQLGLSSSSFPIPGNLLPAVDGFSDPYNVDIPSAIAWLESYLYPEYTTDGKTAVNFSSSYGRGKPPRKFLLRLPNMRLGRTSRFDIDSVACIMLQAETSYTAFFGDGTPRIAKVALQMAEITQVQNRVEVHDAFTLRTAGNFGYRLTQGPSDKKR